MGNRGLVDADLKRQLMINTTPSAMAGFFIACAEPMVDPSDENLIETSVEIAIGSIRIQPSDNHHYFFFMRGDQLPTPN